MPKIGLFSNGGSSHFSEVEAPRAPDYLFNMEEISLQHSVHRSLLVETDPTNAVSHNIPVTARSGMSELGANIPRGTSEPRIYIPFSDYELDPDATSRSILKNIRKLLQTQRSKGRFERFKR